MSQKSPLQQDLHTSNFLINLFLSIFQRFLQMGLLIWFINLVVFWLLTTFLNNICQQNEIRRLNLALSSIQISVLHVLQIKKNVLQISAYLIYSIICINIKFHKQYKLIRLYWL